MRILASCLAAVALLPIAAHAAPQCVVPAAAEKGQGAPIPAAAAPTDTAASLPPDIIARTPALARIASQGATLLDLGTSHGVRGVFAKAGEKFQVFYLTPDGQAVIGGVMWDATGHNITRDQVAPIPGAIPTVRLESGNAPNSGQPDGQASPLKAVAASHFGLLGKEGAPRIWMFVDPYCSFSIRAMNQLKSFADKGEIQLAVIPVSILDYEDQGRSTPAAQAMLSLPPETMVDAWLSRSLDGGTSQDAEAKLRANLEAARSIGLRGTPTLVWQRQDGGEGRADGLPDDLQKIIASIENPA